jgi:transposase
MARRAPHKAFILATVTDRPDITMPELADELLQSKGVKIDPSNLSKLLIACRLSYNKKPSGKRARQA